MLKLKALYYPFTSNTTVMHTYKISMHTIAHCALITFFDSVTYSKILCTQQFNNAQRIEYDER